MNDEFLKKLNNIAIEILEKVKNNNKITINEIKFLFMVAEKNKKYNKQKNKENLKVMLKNGINTISPLITSLLGI